MPYAKKNTYVLSTIYGDALDQFRNAVGNYWELGPYFPQYGDPGTKNNAVLVDKKVNKINTFKIIPRQKKKKSLKKYPFFETTHNFEIYSAKGNYESATSWVGYISRICNPTKIFLDYSFDVETPLSPQELDAQGFNSTSLYDRSDFVYNYYARTYELLTDNDQSPETILPNLYLFLETRKDEKSDKAFQALTAGGELEESQLKSVRLPKVEEKQPSYFNDFARAQRRTPTDTLDRISRNATNIIFDTDSDNIMREAEDFATLFPMHVGLEFTTDSANEMTEVLKDSKLSKSLMSYLSLIPSNPTDEQKTRFSMRTEPMQRFFENVLPNDDFSSTSISVESQEIDVNIIDVNKWIKKVAKNKNFVRRTSLYVQDEKQDKVTSNFEKMMHLIIFSGKLKTLIDKYNRSYLDISDGAKSFSETICYKVEKFSKDGGSTPIQTFWLPNTNEIDAVKYIDTQVKYNKEYQYKVSAYQFIVGSEYQYKNLQFPDEYDAPTVGQQAIINSGNTPAAVSDFQTSATSAASISAAEKPMPILYLYDYPRYVEIMDPFDELMEDLPDEVAAGGHFSYDKGITDIIAGMRQYDQSIATLEAIAATFNTGDTYPAYLNKSKTLIENGRQYLSNMKFLIESFVKEYEDVYLPSVSTDEKRDAMRSISKDLRAALAWIYIMDTHYKQFESFIEKHKKLDEEIADLAKARSQSTGLSSSYTNQINDIEEEQRSLIIEISAVAEQYHKYYDDLNGLLWKYQAIDATNPGNMKPSLQAYILQASELGSEIQQGTGMQSVPGIAGTAPLAGNIYSNSTPQTNIQSNPDLQDFEEGLIITGERDIIDKNLRYISTDKNIFNTRYANRLFVVPKKRESVNEDKFYKANLQVVVRPSVKIAEVPFFETSGTIIDDPPVFPNVDLIPYRGVKDKILINLNSSVGSYEMMPVVFNPREQEIIDTIRLTNKQAPNSPIRFTTDDRVSAFEIYRMQTPPEKIEDFANNLRQFLPTDIDSTTTQKASSASFIDDVNPNTEYYYTFRSVDVHGKISNPSPVYKIIIVENDGAVYPLIEIYQMKKNLPQKPTKTCKKLINIVPRYSQRLINLQKSNIGDGSSVKEVKNLVLGSEEKALFGRKFKVRLTSKKTGKKIDLNINFDVKLDKI